MYKGTSVNVREGSGGCLISYSLPEMLTDPLNGWEGANKNTCFSVVR